MAFLSRVAILAACFIAIVTYVPVPTHTVTATLQIPVLMLDAEEFDCMRANMFFEARNQKSDAAMIAVGYTVLNRVSADNYPHSICGVVYQAKHDKRGNMLRNKCQFSWVCDGKNDTVDLSNVLERKAWERASKLAEAVMGGIAPNPVGNSTMYHASYAKPYWLSTFKKVATIEQHVFYAEKG